MTDNGGSFEDLDRTKDQGPGPAAGRGTRIRATGLSLPAAAVGVLLVATMALGVGGFRPPVDDPAAEEPLAAEEQAADGNADKDADDASKPTPKPATEGATDGDKDQAGGGEEPSTEPEPTDAAVVKVNLDADERDGKVRLEWAACEADDVAAWKVVRSTDETVAWPAGKDTLLAALEPDVHAYSDAKAPEGRKSWYRVFAVAEIEGEYLVRCASDIERVFVPGPEPTPKPTEKPAPDATDKPDVADLELAVKLKDGHPFLDWSQCKSDDFDLYKVVASKDERVKWPTGDNDWVAAAIGERDVTALWDKDAPAGRTLYYRVFCLDKGEDGYRILAVSPVRHVTTPEVDPGPRPEPVELSIEAGAEGGVVWLDWETCDSEGFVYYKVVRSRDDNPSYFPWTDGTELIGVIENPGGSSFEDHDVASGDTWFYRVQSIGKWNGEKVLLGQTRVVRVEVP